MQNSSMVEAGHKPGTKGPLSGLTVANSMGSQSISVKFNECGSSQRIFQNATRKGRLQGAARPPKIRLSERPG